MRPPVNGQELVAMDENSDLLDPEIHPEPMENSRIASDELAGVRDVHSRRFVAEDESMTYGEALTLLIAIGVLIYLVYALLWPEHF
jgi:K+-transporting ATPase KdpF subunit